MARGISIGDVENKVQHISDNNVIPLSTGADVPEVVTVGVLKEHINEDIDTALEGKQDVINDLSAIRSGAALGATAVQIESDPTVPAWAKESQKPSYSYSEITGKPTLATVATSGSYNDLSNKPDIPAAQIQSDWNQSNTSAKDYIKNKPEIPVLPTLADVATSGDYEDLTNTPTIPNVPEWAMSSTKPSYTVSEIDGAQEELVSGTNIKTINNESILGSGNITIQGGGGDVNVIESITFNGSAVPVDASKNAAITYSAPVISVNGNTGAVTINVPTKVSDLTNDSGFITSYTETDPVFSASAAATITSADITAWNGKSTFSGSYNDLTDKPTLFSGDYNDLSNKPTIPTVPTNVSAFTNDAGYITGYTETDPTVPSWAKAASKPSYTAAEVGALPDTTSIPTESTVAGWGFTKNVGTVTSVSMNGSAHNPTNGVVDLGTVITSHQDVSGKENTSNKVTSLSSSSTDAQYPSAKAVYDLVSVIPVASGGVWEDATPKFTTWTSQKYISSVDGSLNNSSVSQSFACDYVDISDYTNIQISLPHLSSNSPAGGCFYDANKQAITPGLNKTTNTPTGMYPYVFAVPVNAKYIRVTWRKDIGGLSFSCYGFTKITVG